MENRQRYSQSDPRRRTIKIRDMPSDVREHLRADISKVDDPGAEALFETTAEVLGRLITVYERGSEEAWRE